MTTRTMIENYSDDKINKNKFIGRVLKYAASTGIRINRVPRLQSWSRLGLPDMRGFTPHLRTVNVSDDQSSQIKNGRIPISVNDADLWLIHDLLHILFYDFATLNLGRKEWQNASRFIEVHLASEAFAVLALDYHHLIFTDKKGLAINLDYNDWGRFQALAPQLPDLNSYFFVKTLLDYYLFGGGVLDTLKGSLGRGKYARRLEDWAGHEQRYATKQRFYVKSWADDLQAKKVTSTAASIEDSHVAEPLWALIQLIHYAPDRDWANYVDEIKAMTKARNDENYFAGFSKYKRSRFPADFRFTDYRSLSKKAVVDTVLESKEPSASALFLFWQIISENTPTLLKPSEKAAVRNLAIESQGLIISKMHWTAVNALALKMLKTRQWKPNPLARSTFFLP